MSPVEWAVDPRCAVTREVLVRRVDAGWDPEHAILVERRGTSAAYIMIEAFGEIKTIAAWARDTRCVVSYGALRSRLRRGWRPEAALTTPAGPSPGAAAPPASGEAAADQEP